MRLERNGDEIQMTTDSQDEVDIVMDWMKEFAMGKVRLCIACELEAKPRVKVDQGLDIDPIEPQSRTMSVKLIGG